MTNDANFTDRSATPDFGVVVVSDHGSVNGGQAKIAIESALSLKRRGVEVCFVAGCGPADKRLLDAGIECHVVGNYDILSDPSRLRAAASGIWNRSAARILAQSLVGRDPRSTVIHVHGWAKVLSPSIGPVVMNSGAAHVYTLHEYFLACPNGGFFDYQAQAICNRRAMGVDCLRTACDVRSSSHKVWRVARQAVLRTAGRMPRDLREIIYIAPEQLDIMGPYIPPDARWHHLPNPVGPRPDERVTAERNRTFLFVGRLSPEKGAEVAARAARAAGVEIAFCGEGPCRDAILQANPDAKVLGWLGQAELAAWMQRARCLVFPSLWYEGYPLAVADALRIGLPIMVSNTSAAASLVEHGQSGLHVPVGDVQAWAVAMQSLDDAVIHRYSEAAFAAGKELLDEDQYVDRLLCTYREAIERRKTTGLPATGSVA